MGYETDLANVALDGSKTKIELMSIQNRDLDAHELGALMLCKHKGIESMRINDTSTLRDDHEPGQAQYVEFTPTSAHPHSHVEFSLNKRLLRDLLEHNVIISALSYNQEHSAYDHKIFFNDISVESDF